MLALKMKSLFSPHCQACFTGPTTCYFSLAAALPHSSEASFSFNALTNGRLARAACQKNRHRLKFLGFAKRYDLLHGRRILTILLFSASSGSQHLLFSPLACPPPLTAGYTGAKHTHTHTHTDIRGYGRAITSCRIPLLAPDDSSRRVKAPSITLPSVFLP